jgi:hypothetical protein
VATSDKLFFWIFQRHPAWISHLLPDLTADASAWMGCFGPLQNRSSNRQ